MKLVTRLGNENGRLDADAVAWLLMMTCMVMIVGFMFCITINDATTSQVMGSTEFNDTITRQADEISEIQTRASNGEMSSDDVTELASCSDVTSPWYVAKDGEQLTWSLNGFTEDSRDRKSVV